MIVRILEYQSHPRTDQRQIVARHRQPVNRHRRRFITQQTVQAGDVSATVLHVGDLHASTSTGRGGKWNATVTVTVHDESENPVPNAVVGGNWTAGVTGGASCTTNGSGQCSVSKNNIKSSVDSVAFTIDTVARDADGYDSGANHDPDVDSDGTTIVVATP